MFYSKKYDWSWLGDYTLKVQGYYDSMKDLENLQMPDFDEGNSTLEWFSRQQPPDYSMFNLKSKPYGPEWEQGTFLYDLNTTMYNVAMGKLMVLNQLKNGYPDLQGQDSVFKESLLKIKETIGSLNTGAKELQSTFKAKLDEAGPWIELHNDFTYNACVLIFLFVSAQAVFLVMTSIPRYSKFLRFSNFMWITNVMALCCFAVSTHFQSQYASVNHDMCLLFEPVSTGAEIPRTFMPESLQGVMDVCVHQPEDQQDLNTLFHFDY